MGQGTSTHPIHSAGRTGDVRVIRHHAKHPAILNRRDADDMTCLHWAAQLGHINIIQELVTAEVVLDPQDANGWTPLMHACCRGHKLAVGLLLAAGADIEVESEDGRTALHRAATWKRLGPLDQFLTFHARSSFVRGRTSHALASGSLLTMPAPMVPGAPPHLLFARHYFNSYDAFAQLIEAGGNVRHEARDKWTPLHCAAAAGDAHACAILIEAGADANSQDSSGQKPVDVIADMSAREHVTNVLLNGRHHPLNASPRPTSSTGLARASMPAPSLQLPPINMLKGSSVQCMISHSITVEGGLRRSYQTVDGGAVNSTHGSAQEENRDHKIASIPSIAIDTASGAGTVADAGKHDVEETRSGGRHADNATTLKRGSWTRPTLPSSKNDNNNF